MTNCPTCSSPIQQSWKVCATCGNPLPYLPTGTIEQVKKPNTGLILGFAGGGIAVIALLVVLMLPYLSPQPITPSTLNPDNETQQPMETPKEVGTAEKIESTLIDSSTCTSAWSRDEYLKSPSFGIDVAFWDSGDLRVCQVERTSKAPTRWITIITGQVLLQDFGKNWAVPFGSVAIREDSWTLIIDSIPGEVNPRNDPVVQAILAKLGGTYSTASK